MSTSLLPANQIPISLPLLGDLFPRISYDTVNQELFVGNGTSLPSVHIGAGVGAYVNILDYGAVAGGSAATNAISIQAAADAVAALTEGGTVLIPNGVFTTSAIIYTKSKVRFLGQNRASSKIRGSNSLVSPTIHLGDGGSGITFGNRLQNMAVDANGAALAVFSDQCNEMSGLDHCLLLGATTAAAKFNGAGQSTGGGASSVTVNNCEIYVGTLACTNGLWFNHTDGANFVTGSTTINGDSAGFTRGLYVISSIVQGDTIHAEHATYGVYYTSSSAGTITCLVGGPGLTNACYSDCGHLNILTIAQNGATHTFVEGTLGQTFDDAILDHYSTSLNTTSTQFLFGSAPSTPASGRAVVYARDGDGGGHGQLVAKFADGSIEVLGGVGRKSSGALSTVALSSGVGAQVTAIRDVNLYVQTATAGSCVVAVSPDNVTYTTIYTKTTLTNDVLPVRVPAGWYVKVTATTSTIGIATYY